MKKYTLVQCHHSQQIYSTNEITHATWKYTDGDKDNIKKTNNMYICSVVHSFQISTQNHQTTELTLTLLLTITTPKPVLNGQTCLRWPNLSSTPIKQKYRMWTLETVADFITLQLSYAFYLQDDIACLACPTIQTVIVALLNKIQK